MILSQPEFAMSLIVSDSNKLKSDATNDFNTEVEQKARKIWRDKKKKRLILSLLHNHTNVSLCLKLLYHTGTCF